MKINECLQRLGKSVSSKDSKKIQSLIDQGVDEKDAVATVISNIDSELDQVVEFASNQGLPVNLRPETFKQDVDQTQTNEFVEWAGTDKPVIEPDEINEYNFNEEGPFVIRGYHGTTNQFEEFDASVKGQSAGHFGQVNYFTTSEYDAEQNYLSDGPDLTNRVENLKEQLENEYDILVEELNGDLDDIAIAINDKYGIDLQPLDIPLNEDDTVDTVSLASDVAERSLRSGDEQVLEVFVRTENPFVVNDDNSPFLEMYDNEVIEQEALERVAEFNEVSVEDVQNNIDEYQDEIEDARYEVLADTESPLVEAIEQAAIQYDIDSSEVLASFSEFLFEPELQQNILERAIRTSREFSYLEDAEGNNIHSQILSDVIQNLGFDSIILKNADRRFSAMDMPQGTVHIHVFDADNTNIKSATDNAGTFDRSNPNIFKQQESNIYRGEYDPKERVIRLTEAANASTFFHEFAHFMFEMERGSNSQVYQTASNWHKRNAKSLADEANRYSIDDSGTLAKITEQDVVDFVKNESHPDKNKSRYINRAIHEQFARGFETYIMEGKSPSIELRNVFRTFARLLVQIYQSIRGNLRVNLDDDMRETFDRLIATEEQIAAARARQQYEPLFTDAAMAGMTDEQFQKYQAKQKKANDVQVETLRDKLMREITRRTKKEWQEEKQDIIDELLINLRTEPVYRARDALKNSDVKLDRDAVKQIVTEEKQIRGKTVKAVPTAFRGMTENGGMNLDEAATLFGFPTGEELVKAINDQPELLDRADSEAESIMLERHGDIMNDGTIEQLADEALLGEQRADVLLSEYRQLTRGTSQPVLEKRALKDLAEENIGKLNFRQLFPEKYRRQQLQAAREAAVALSKGDKATAAEAKTRELMNYYLALSATNARQEIQKAVDNMNRYSKKTVQQEIQKAGNEYWEQIVKILARFEFRKSATLKSVDQKNSDINSWVRERIEQDGDELALTEAVLNETYIDHWKNIPFDRLMGIKDSVKNIEHVARHSNQVTLQGEKIQFAKLKDQLLDQMSELKTRFTAQRNTGQEVSGLTSKEKLSGTGKKISRFIRSQNAMMTKIQIMARWLDGGKQDGKFTQLFDWSVNDAVNQEKELWKEVVTPILEKIKTRTRKDKQRMLKSYYIPEIKTKPNDNGILTGHQILSVALNAGNQSSLRKMLLGEGWAKDETEVSIQNPKLQAVLKHLTKSDLELIQAYLDAGEKLYPLLAATSEKASGVKPPKIEASPIVTPVGTIPGGYYVIDYDHNRSSKVAEFHEKRMALDSSMFSTVGSLNQSVNAGSINERTNFFAPINFDLNAGINNMQEVIHYITHFDLVRQLNKIIRDDQISMMMKEKLTPEDFAQFKPWLMDIAKNGRTGTPNEYGSRIMNHLRLGTTYSYLAWKVSTLMVQPLGLLTSASQVGGIGNVGKALFKVVTNMPMDGTNEWKQRDFALQNSKVLKHRVQSFDREIVDAAKELQGKWTLRDAANQMGMRGIGYVQLYAVDLATWTAAYDQSLELFEGDHDKAVARADSTLKLTQGSGEISDLPALLRSNNAFLRLFTTFMTWFNSRWNLTRDGLRGLDEGYYNTLEFGAKIFYLYVASTLLDAIMRGEFDEEDDIEDVLLEAGVRVAASPAQDLPFARNVVNAWVTGFDYNPSAPLQLFEKGINSTDSIVDGDLSRYETKSLFMMGGTLMHIGGTSQAWNTGEHLYEVLAEGEELTLDQLLFGVDRDK